MLLSRIFKEIKADPLKYATSNTGEDFEANFMKLLRKEGFIHIKAGKNFSAAQSEIKELEKNSTFSSDAELKQILKKIKEQILDKTSTELVENPFQNFNEYFIYQPYGSQNFPDFLVFSSKYIIPIETKFSKYEDKLKSKEISSRPVWNSNLPKANAIYLYAVSGRDTTFFMGSDILNNDVRRILIEYFENLDKGTDQLDKLLSNLDNNFGFYPYIRKAYEQKQEKSTYQKDGKIAIESYFSNKRDQRENTVIDFLSSLEDKEKK
ncbi:hypothetical protein [Mycoplasma phocoeninasale]|uniref:hypothetical protein n=1 Tax=Mycoplasma phocoeninasale TaxID=2726117 RepID=UPI0019682F54|nr:hypothetical protein [Mycoplasma phocoeninasale]MBN0970433.1 hypothetical protein [Mycoplasma phocoeninasale]